MSSLPPLDWAIIGLYLVGVLLVGLYAGGRQESTRDYFIGDRSLPWWAVTLSIVATETSAVTFIGVPGLAYNGDWYFLQVVFGFVLGRVFLGFFFLRIFYRFDILTVYTYLEKRYGNVTRVLAAGFFLMGRVIASGVRLFAACLAVHIATSFSIELAIVLLGVLGIAYTLLGGIRAVVWTDAILGITFILGGAVAVIFLLRDIGGAGAVPVATEALWEKLQVFYSGPPTPAEPPAGAAVTNTSTGSWSAFFASDRPFWIAFVGGFFLTLATHGVDQDNVQRMLSCKDDRAGIKSLLGSAVVILPLIMLFLAIGTLLWYSHATHPELKPAIPENAIGNPADYYFPYFIAERLPSGVRGFVFAGIFAAALSSLTSVINALAATTVADFYRPFFRSEASDRHYLLAGRVLTVLWGFVLIGLAISFVGSDDGVLTLALKVLTYFYGAILGVFLLGIMTGRGNVLTTSLGMLLGLTCVLLLQLRAFLDNAESAPPWAQRLLEALPGGFRGTVEEFVPLLAWPLWVGLGALVSFGVGLLGNQAVARRGRTIGQREQ